MMNPAIESLLDRSDSKFTLVTLAAKRARQINSYFNQLGDGLGAIVPPQVALVGFGAIHDEPWAESGLLGVRPVVTASLAADHRATDGRVGARFLDVVKNALQHP